MEGGCIVDLALRKYVARRAMTRDEHVQGIVRALRPGRIVQKAIACLAVLLLAVASPVFAHGPEPHEVRSDEASLREDARTSGETDEASAGADAAAAAASGTTGLAAPQHTASSVLGGLHPATVHFPIAFLIGAALLALVGRLRPEKPMESGVRLLLTLGAIGAGIAMIFGWVHTGLWWGGGPTMQWHRWLGSGIAVVALFLALAARRGDTGPAFRGGLYALALVIGLQAYLGGELAHGPFHLAEH